jgi:osmotically inducible protein OsmC
MRRQGTAEWKGGLKNGNGTVSTESGAVHNMQYSFTTRFEEGKGTNPEELIAAAHAGCFSMAFSALLENAGFLAESIQTTAIVTIEKSVEGFSIPAIHLEVMAKVPHMESNEFNDIANQAKKGCPVSKLMNATITMNAKLED